MNQISDKLDYDYKLVQHHLNVLEKTGVVNKEESKEYGRLYFISNTLAGNMDLFDEIDQLSKK